MIEFLSFSFTDTGSELLRIKAHSSRIERISFPIQRGVQMLQRKRQLAVSVESTSKRELKNAKPSKNATGLFLVATSECAKLYGMKNFVQVHQLNYGVADALERIDQLQWVPKSDLLVGCGLSGMLRVWKSDFTQVKQLDLIKMKVNYLKKFKMKFVGNDIDGNNPCDNQDNSIKEINRVIKTMTINHGSKGYVKSAQLTKNGKFILLNCINNTLIIVSIDAWQICKVLAFSNVFITQFEIVHSEQHASSQTQFCIVAKTVESDLLLMNLEDDRKSYIACSPENKCYKFHLSSNGKMLAQVLKSGEILLHSLEFHSCAVNVNKLQHSTPERTGKAHSRPTSTGLLNSSVQQLNGETSSKDNLTTPSPISSYTAPLTVASFTSMTTASSRAIYRKNSKLKLAMRLEEIHDKVI